MAANKQGWDDFDDLVDKTSQTKGDVRELAHKIKKLIAIKDEILNDPIRKAEMKKVLDQHHDKETNTTTKLKNICTKLETLLTFLEDNNYL